MNRMNSWDSEYEKRGIPSSFREDPSGVLTWALTNWPLLTGGSIPNSVVDVGCGTGRNAMHMANLGIDVIAFDTSEVALQFASHRLKSAVAAQPTFLKHDLASGIPAATGQIDLVTDIFVYKHQLLPSARSQYRKEVRRVLKPHGRILISLADRRDGFYADCPEMSVPEIGNPRTVIDPVAGIGSVLFDLQDLVSEMSDLFNLEMSWQKIKPGLMHGKHYLRRTLATIWQAKEAQGGAS